jgi:hypothetical protein
MGWGANGVIKSFNLLGLALKSLNADMNLANKTMFRPVNPFAGADEELKTLRRKADEARDDYFRTKQASDAALAKPLFGPEMYNKFHDLQEKARKQAEQLAAAAKKGGGGPGPDSLERHNDLLSKAKSLHEELGGAVDKLGTKYQDLFDTTQKGLLSRAEYLQGLGKFAQDAMGKLEVKSNGPRGIESGSKEAFESLRAYREFGSQRENDPIKALQRLQEEQLKRADEQIRVGRAIEKAIIDGQLKVQRIP